MLVFLSIVFGVLAIGIKTYNEAKAIIEKRVQDTSFQFVSQLANSLQILIRAYEDLSLQIIVNRDIGTTVNVMETSADQYVKFESSRKLSEYLQSYTLGNSRIVGMMLLPSRR